MLNQGIQALFIQLMIYGKFLCTFCYCKKEYNSEPKAISTMPCSLNSRERQTLHKKFTVAEGNDHFQEGGTQANSVARVGLRVVYAGWWGEVLWKKYYLSRNQNKECIEPCTYFGKKCFIKKNGNCTGPRWRRLSYLSGVTKEMAAEVSAGITKDQRTADLLIKLSTDTSAPWLACLWG